MNNIKLAKALVRIARELVAQQTQVVVKILPNNFRHLGDDAEYIECKYSNPTISDSYIRGGILDDVKQMEHVLNSVLGNDEWVIDYDMNSVKITVYDAKKVKKAKAAIVNLLKKHYDVKV